MSSLSEIRSLHTCEYDARGMTIIIADYLMGHLIPHPQAPQVEVL